MFIFSRLIALIIITIFTLDLKAEDTEQLKQNLAELFDMYAKENRFRGSVIVALNDEVLLSEGYGLASERWQIKNTSDTRFAVASLSKQFTAATALALIEKDKLSLDKTIDHYLPNLRQDVASKITLHDLLTHTSGVRREVFEDEKDMFVYQSNREIITAINKTGLRFEPGSESAYSNTGYVLIRIIIENVTKQPFATVVDDLVFKPANMTSSGWVNSGSVIPKMATGYDLVLGNVVPAELTHPTKSLGAGGMYTTVTDLNAYDRALREGKVLSFETQKLRLSEKRFSWGLGWKLMSVGKDKFGQDQFAVYHNGDYSGVGSHYFRFPDDGLVIALLSNQSNLPRTELFQKIVGIINGGEATPPKPKLADEIYEVVVKEGEMAGVEYAKKARSEKRRGVPNAMKAIQVGNVLSRIGRSEDARRVYAYAALIDPDAPWGHLGLGQWYEEAGEIEKAREQYQKVLKNDPGQPHAKMYLKALEEE